MKLNKSLFLIVVLTCAAIIFAGCDTTSTNTANGNTTAANGNTANTTSNTGANTATDTAKTDTAAADKIGVPECDDFLEKYEACITDKVPEASRAQFKSSIDQWRSSWKQLASNPQTKSTLVAACKQTMETAKQSTSAYSCQW